MTDRWSIEAVISRIELHPEFKEAYVEGEGDMGLYGWFLDEAGRSDVLVYPISAVEVPYHAELGFDDERMDRESRRTEVIILASALQSNVPDAWEQVTCIADADTQYLLPEKYTSRFLLLTDYTSIELYAFRADLITKMIRIASPKLRLKGESILKNLTPTLEALFSIRVANHSLKWGLIWAPPEKQCACRDGEITFDEDTFIKKYLNTKGKRKNEAEFRDTLTRLRQAFGQDHRRQIRGHDFIELLLWYLKMRSNRAYQRLTTDAVLHILFSQLRTQELAAEPLFIELLRRYGPVSGNSN